MSCEFTIVFRLPNGLHARPASLLSATAARFASQVRLTNERHGGSADARSVLSVIALDIHDGDPCRFVIDGIDAAEAEAALRRFVERTLPASEAPPAMAAGGAPRREMARGLARFGARVLTGQAAGGGVGDGVVVRIDALSLPADALTPRGGPAEELCRFDAATAAVRAALERAAGGSGSSVERALTEAHRAIAGDAALRDAIREKIVAGCSAAEAVVRAGASFEERLHRAESAYVRQRAMDVRDVCVRLIEALEGPDRSWPAPVLAADSIVVAVELTPRQFLSLDRSRLRGLVLAAPGLTSHVVILARSFGVPTVVGVADAMAELQPRCVVTVDGEAGIVIVEPGRPVDRYYASTRRAHERRRVRDAAFAAEPAATGDGVSLRVDANVASVDETALSRTLGADGVGLFRTEMLFMDHESPPGEAEQFEIYAAAVRAAAGRPVTFRALDIGGDKPARFLPLEPEANPFLGCRGVRLYERHERLFLDQVRAIVRASAFGPVRLMAPMIATADEVGWVRERITRVQAELRAAGTAFDETMAVGAMIEVPSAAFQIETLARELDFFSIGTNDLSQYFFAAERANRHVAALADVLHPGFLRLLAGLVATARAAGRETSLCGEMARDPLNLPLMVGLGLSGISVAAGEIPALKRRLRRLRASDGRSLLAEALTRRRADEVRALAAAALIPEGDEPLLALELVDHDCDVDDRESALRGVGDLLFGGGRTDDPTGIENALWTREDAGPTSLGFGFAVPHCQTDLVAADSVCVLRPRQPMAWSPDDDQPVGLVIALVMRGGASVPHLRVLAKLARRLTDEAFRQALMAAPDGAGLLRVLGGAIEPGEASG